MLFLPGLVTYGRPDGDGLVLLVRMKKLPLLLLLVGVGVVMGQ